LSEDAAEIEQVLADLGDTNEAMLARQRLEAAREEDTAWTSASSANDAASLRQYLNVFPRGKHAADAKAKLKAIGRAHSALQPGAAALQNRLQALPTWTIAIIASALGILAALLAYSLEPFWLPLSGVIANIYLLSVTRALYVAGFIVLVAGLTPMQSIWKWIAVIAGVYALEINVFFALAVMYVPEAFITFGILLVLSRGLVMLLEWFLVAVLFFSLKDRTMMGIAGAIGAASGALFVALVFFLAHLAVPKASLVAPVIYFPAAALCLAYGIRRQSEDRRSAGASAG
jgi:hypothetical protein